MRIFFAFIAIAATLAPALVRAARISVYPDGQKKAVVAVTAVTLSHASYTLTVGDNHTLTPTLLPANATGKAIAWSSSDTTVATVSNGKVTARAMGTATITATCKAVAWATTCSTVVAQSNGAVVPYEIILHNTNGTDTVLCSGSHYTLTTVEGGDVAATCTLTVTPLPPDPEGSMVLGNLVWASVNVDNFRTFATKPDTLTKLYQFNRPTAYSATDPVTPPWDASIIDEDSDWAAENDPCPIGWRVPTHAEHTTLANAGHTYAEKNTRGNAIAGMFFGTNAATCSIGGSMYGCVFLPALTLRDGDGWIYKGENGYGYYWSATQIIMQVIPTASYVLCFAPHNFIMPVGFGGAGDKQEGISIRCVRDL